MNSVNSRGSFRQWPAIADAAAPIRLPGCALITPPTVETHHRCGGERPRGLVELEHERHPQRETHRQRIAQRMAPLAAGRLTPGGTAPLQKGQVHTLVPLMDRNGAGAGDQRQIGGFVEQFYPYRRAEPNAPKETLGLTSINRSLLLSDRKWRGRCSLLPPAAACCRYIKRCPLYCLLLYASTWFLQPST